MMFLVLLWLLWLALVAVVALVVVAVEVWQRVVIAWRGDGIDCGPEGQGVGNGKYRATSLKPLV